MKQLSRIFSFLMFCLLFTTCLQVPTELNRAESLIETKPDSAMKILLHFPSTKRATDRNKALFWMVWIQVQDKKNLSLKPDSLLDFSIQYYQNHPEGDRLATCYWLKGRALKYSFQYEQAVTFLLKALDCTENSQNSLLLGRIHFDLGEIHSTQRDYSPARKEFTQAYRCFKNGKADKQAFYSMLYIGRTYHESKEYTCALSFYTRMLPMSKDSLLRGAVLQELGLNYYDAKQYPKALVCLQEVIDYPYLENNKAIRYMMLADLYYDLNQTEQAFRCAKRALSFNHDIRTKKNCCRILVNSSTGPGKMAKIKKYMKLYQDCSDSIKKIDTQTKGSYIETMHTTRMEVVKTKHWLWYLAGLILLVIGLSLFSYSRLHKRKEKQLTETKEQHKNQKTAYQKAAMQRHREALVHKIAKTKASQTAVRKQLLPAEKDALDKKLYDDILHFSDTVYFFKLMDANMNNLMSKIKERYKEVSDREICWCCLSLLNVPLRDILLLLQYKLETQDKMKARLAKKFQLQYASELMCFLQDILSED
ncbi:MAG: tetratricopeptide repeat protein [Paludibacter sp.]|nr:tetratricopeptide repeat protein [Paludibacter sp.]